MPLWMDTRADADCFHWCSLHLVCCIQKPQKVEINLYGPYLLCLDPLVFIFVLVMTQGMRASIKHYSLGNSDFQAVTLQVKHRVLASNACKV